MQKLESVSYVINKKDPSKVTRFLLLNQLGLLILSKLGGGGGGQWRKMAKNGDGEFGFFICQIRHFSPIFDFGISDLTDF